MKKIILVLSATAILTTGCGNISENIQAHKIKTIAKDLAVASANNDEQKVIKLSNEMYYKRAIIKEIHIKGICHEVIYTYKGKENSFKHCRQN